MRVYAESNVTQAMRAAALPEIPWGEKIMKFLVLLCFLFLGLLPAFAQRRLIEGNPSSSVRVIVYEDLQCPDCAVFREMMDKTLLPQFGAKVAFEHHDFPLAKHAWARKASIAARYLTTISPEVAVEFRRTTMAHLGEIKADTFNDHLTAFARAHGIDPDKALAALNDPQLAAAVEADFQDGVARGIAHTPTVIVNGEPFIESFPVEDIAKSITKALAEGKQ
jgi:protein-disulfide isomerase